MKSGKRYRKLGGKSRKRKRQQTRKRKGGTLMSKTKAFGRGIVDASKYMVGSKKFNQEKYNEAYANWAANSYLGPRPIRKDYEKWEFMGQLKKDPKNTLKKRAIQTAVVAGAIALSPIWAPIRAGAYARRRWKTRKAHRANQSVTHGIQVIDGLVLDAQGGNMNALDDVKVMSGRLNNSARQLNDLLAVFDGDDDDGDGDDGDQMEVEEEKDLEALALAAAAAAAEVRAAQSNLSSVQHRQSQLDPDSRELLNENLREAEDRLRNAQAAAKAAKANEADETLKALTESSTSAQAETPQKKVTFHGGAGGISRRNKRQSKRGGKRGKKQKSRRR